MSARDRGLELETTPWRTILRLYDRLLEHDPSAVIELNRAVALAEVEGPKAGLSAIECANRRGALEDYQPYHAARANLLERVGAHAESAAAYERAIELAGNRVDRDHLEARRGGLDPPNDPVGPR